MAYSQDVLNIPLDQIRLYEVLERSDGRSYGLLAVFTDGTELLQSDIDAAIESLESDGIEDWNITDICERLPEEFETAPFDIFGLLYI